jgi:alpha-tubulin suppressor-like RCC1 family protein
MPNTTGKTPVQVISGAGHTVVLMTDGTIYAVGDNASGQLGNGTTTGANTLTLMTNNTGRVPIRISAGEHQTVVLMADYSIYGTGGNFWGQLGIGTNGTGTNVTTLTLVNNTNWSGKVPRSISCGHTHMIVLMTDGTIFGTGLNSNGELGNGNNTNRNTLGLISNTTTKTIRTVSCAGNHTMFLMTDNTVWGTGYNGEGTLGDGTTTNRNTLTQLTSSSTYNIFQLCDTENTSVVLDTNGVTLKYVGISSASIVDRMILIEANPMGTGMEWFAVTSSGAIMTPAGFKTEYDLSEISMLLEMSKNRKHSKTNKRQLLQP